MIDEEIKKKLKDLLNQKEKEPTKKIDELCKENSFTRYRQKKDVSWGKRNPNNNESHWDNLNLDEYVSNKPVLVCLGGTATKKEKEANGICKMVEGLLELMFKVKDFDIKAEDKVDIISCIYGFDIKYLFYLNDDEVKKMYPNLKEYAKKFPEAVKTTPQNAFLDSNTAQQFVKNMLLSRCLDKKGNKLPIDECQRNIAQVIFFSYCFGTKALNLIMDNFYKLLSQNNFNNKEIEKITSSMSHISFARLKYTRKIPTTYFYAVNDYDLPVMYPLLSKMKFSKSQLETRLSKKGESTFGQKILKDVYDKETNAEALEFAYIGIEKDKIADKNNQDVEHYLSNLRRNKDWDIVNKKDEIYNAISQMMSWSLCRAVENGLDNANSDKYVPKIPMVQLKDELMDIYKSFSKEDLMTKQ